MYEDGLIRCIEEVDGWTNDAAKSISGVADVGAEVSFSRVADGEYVVTLLVVALANALVGFHPDTVFEPVELRYWRVGVNHAGNVRLGVHARVVVAQVVCPIVHVNLFILDFWYVC